MDPIDKAHELLEEWEQCRTVIPKNKFTHAFDHEGQKRLLDKWAILLKQNVLYSNSLNEIAESANQFENRFNDYKKQLTEDILKNGLV